MKAFNVWRLTSCNTAPRTGPAKRNEKTREAEGVEAEEEKGEYFVEVAEGREIYLAPVLPAP